MAGNIGSLIELADLIEGAPTRWLSAAGYVKSFTFTLGEADQVASALRLSAQQREPVVRVKELEWTSVFGRPATRAESLSSIGLYIIADLDGTERFSVGLDNGACAAFLLDEAGNKQLRYSSIHEAAAAAQADYEARIMAAIEIAPQSDRRPLPGQKQISETGKELPENAEQPMNNADVSVGELAGFFATEFPPLMTMSTQIEVARALLARYEMRRR